ncbi:hypothetical protein JCM21900_002876 [Sporobolomyces salmonicolor]
MAPLSSPIIRKPSLGLAPRRKRALTPPLPRPLLHLVRALIVALVLWFEYGTFYASARFGCGFDDSPSTKGRVWDGSLALSETRGGWRTDERWREAARAGRREGQPFHVLVVADPQLLDMRSYPGRNWALRWLGVKVTDMYARKSWRFVSRKSRGKGGGGVDAVVWLGDLLDSGVEMVDRREHSHYVHRFHLLFPLPRASAVSPSQSVSSSSSLTPPIPSILLPGNHDLGLHVPSSALASYSRERFAEAFGPTWGEREWNGWTLVWVDSMALLEAEFREGRGGEFSDMKAWLEDLGKGDVTTPRILLTHIPLFRPEGTSCGRSRESSRPIRQGSGKNYQNELDEEITRWLVERVRPTLVYSGDDHDSCIIRHPYTSPMDGLTPVTETTVKAFSMAMGIRRPGYHLLSLYAPLPPPLSDSFDPAFDPSTAVPSPAYTATTCLLPDQLGIYLHIYLPLLLTFTLFFLLPKLALVVRSSLRKRRNASARGNGLPVHSSGGGGGAGHSHKRSLSKKLLGRGDSDEEAAEDADSLFPTFFGASQDMTYGYSAGIDADSLPTSNLTGSSSGPDGEEDESGHSSPSNGRVRRVSRVWLWEKDGPSPFSSLDDDPSGPSSYASFSSRLRSTLADLVDRLSSNTLLGPLARILLRPLYRAVRMTFRKLVPSALLGRLLAAGPGQAVSETVEQTWEVAWPGVAAWAAVWVWFSL